MKYLYLDTETGGVNPRQDALLTIGLVAHDDEIGILDKLHIWVKPEDRRITEGALKVNRINMEEHMKVAVARLEAATMVSNFIVKNFGKGFANKPVVVGHNVQFDRNFVDPLFEEIEWGLPYSYRTLDTMGIGLFLQDTGYIRIPNLKLDSMIEYFGCEIAEEDRHTALGDALVTREVHLAMRKLVDDPFGESK